MPRVIFMCGPAGSGKSTLAREFEAGGMVRLSFDEEAWRRGIRTQPLSAVDRTEIVYLATPRDVVLARARARWAGGE